MSRARSNSTAGFLLNSLQKNARRLSLARFTNRVESIDLEHQSESNELQRIRQQLKVTIEKQKKREMRKEFQLRNNREPDNEYVPYEEMGTAAFFILLIFVVFILYVAEREITHLKFIQQQKNILTDMQN